MAAGIFKKQRTPRCWSYGKSIGWSVCEETGLGQEQRERERKLKEKKGMNLRGRMEGNRRKEFIRERKEIMERKGKRL
jgi:hypothetical protein